MLRIPRFSLALLAAGLFGGPVLAQEPIRLARTPDISPDGKLVAFSYLGDIWVVESIGGTARPITSHPAHELNPVFSPDGRFLAFSSNRHGSYDVYVVPVQGGRPRRLTFDSSTDLVCGWSPDGKQVLFASTRGTEFPLGFQLFTVPVEGGMVRRVTTAGGKEGVFSPSGDRLAYVLGPGSWYRKGYRGSSNDDIWIANADGTNNRLLTAFNGQDSSPMWGADGQTLYYVSEFFGTPANIVRQSLTSSGAKPTQVTFHKDESVRRARLSANGAWIVYECGPDLWVTSTQTGAAPRKLAIAVYADDKANPERLETFTGKATEFTVSADERFAAFAVHGKLFRMPIGPNAKVTQMTDGPSNDHGAAWSLDGSKIVFISDRNGHDDVYLLESNDPGTTKVCEANRFKVTQLTHAPQGELGVTFSPDGKRVTFIRSGKLCSMKPDGSDAKEIVSDPFVIDYEWSPDSRWIVYARRDGHFASELYLIPATGATEVNPARNITRYATTNVGVTWSADGKKIAFLSDRRGLANLYVIPMQKPAVEGYKERPLWPGGPDIDWEDIHLRAQTVAPLPAAEAAISPDGSKVAFRDAVQGDLWVASTTGGQLTRLTTGRSRPHYIQWSKRKSPFGGTLDVLYFLDGEGKLRMARAGGGEAKPGDSGPTSSNFVTLPFKIKMTIRTEDLYNEMFDQSWRYLAEHFYDNKFHGLDWDAVRNRYRPLVKHVALKEDLYALLYLMMGELNASHLGISGFTAAPEEMTADLGLVFDETYRGPGLKILEVLKRGPCDKRGLVLRPNEYVLAIDDVELNGKTEISKLLNGKEGEVVVLQVASSPAADPKARRRVEVHPEARSRVVTLMYERWVENNARRVADLSKGKLGYIHIPSMDEAGLDHFVRALYSDNFNKEAIVLDVRYNSGGNTHDQVLNYLGARQHTVFKQRDGGEGPVLVSSDRKWTKPLVLLINNQSFSDAEIFPSAFRTLGLGKLVGQPTGGFVIGTGVVPLIDGSLFRIPRIGVYTTQGVNMDKQGVNPDVVVDTHPDQLAKGVDAQLEKAVEVLNADLLAAKKPAAPVTGPTAPKVVVKPAPEAKPVPTMPPAMP